ncbi:PAS domain S-box protein [Leptolyngbya sp. PL-A3]|uniref:PAS domain S-box protein n=1 Tax=Leptolyngbya sp. PL-A3 TaxID=2933911 RepID=UPI0032998AD5
MVTSEEIFVGGGEMGVLMRSLDWSQTPLGPAETWSQSLRTSLSICLMSRFPILIWWGPELVMLYNDAYRPILGATKHPKALGQRGAECWQEGWSVTGPMLEGVLATQQSTQSDDQLLVLSRNGYLEECYFTFSYSPIPDETGQVGGVFTAVTETTARVISERRLKTLRDLAGSTTKAKTITEACCLATQTLTHNPYDVPFALLYLVKEGNQADLVSTVGIEAGTAASPHTVDLTGTTDSWNLNQVKATGQPQWIENLTSRFGETLPQGVWSEAPRTAFVMPIAQLGQKEQLAGLLVLGISPRRAFDQEYHDFFGLVASNITTAITEAQTYEAERKRAESLQEAEAVYQHVNQILECITDAFVTFDRQWCYTYANPAALQLLQKSPEELLGKNVWQVFPGEVGGLTYRELHRALEEQVSVSWEEFGEPVQQWLEVRAYPSPGGVAVYFQDISDRKRIEEELRKSEQQLRSAIEVARFSPYEWNPVTDELIWDARLKAMWGLAPDAEVNLAVHNAGLHPEDREYVEQQAAKAIAPNGDGIFEAEFRVIGIEDRIERWILARGQTLFDAERRPIYYVGAAQDISDRKRAEAALRESEERFRVLADCAPSLIWLNGADGGCEFVNQAYLDFFGKTLEEIQGFGWQVDLHPDDAEPYVSAYLEALQEHKPFQAKVRVKRADGQYRWLDCYAAPRFSNSGDLLGYVGTSFDITDRRQTEEALRESEERFRTLAATVPQLIWTATHEGNVDYLSNQWADYIGLPPEQSYDWDWQQVVHPDDLPNTLRDWAHSLQSCEPLEIQHRFRYRTGEWRWQLVRGIPVKDATGQVTKWVGTCTDIHDSKLREQDTQFLSDLSEVIRTSDSAAHLMTMANEMIGRYLQLKRCYFAQTDEANDRAWITSDYHTSLPSLVGEHRLSHYPPFVLDLLRSGQLQVSNDNKHDPRTADCYATVYEPLAIRAHVVVPFFMDGRWAVNLIAATNEPRQWQEREINLLETAAERVWLAVEKLRSEVALRESEDRYRALTELSPQLVFMSRPDGFITYVNQWGLDFTGRSLSEFQGNGWSEFIHPEYRDRAYETWMTATSNVSDYDIEIPFRHANGEYRWLYARALPVTNDVSEIEYWIGVAIDITDRKYAEAALRESEERLRFAMEAAQMGSWDLDIRTGKLIWSEQYFKVLGYEPIENREASYEMWSSRVHPDDRELVLQKWQQSKLNHQLYRTEYRVIRADSGEIAWVASLGSFTYDETGQPIRALGVVFDITDRKQMDAALRESLAILNTVNEVTPTLIYIKDRQRRLQMVNPATARLLGKSVAELIGKTEVDYLGPEDAAQIAENDCRVMESGQVITFEELVVVPEGNRIFLSAKAPYRDEQGNIIGLIGVSTDITDRKQAEATLQESERRFRRLVESNMFGVAFGDFTGGFHYVNDYFLQMIGYTREELETGQVKWMDINPPEFLPLDEQAAVELRTKGTATPFEKEYIRKDGTRVPILIGLALLQEPYDQQQDIIAFYVNLSDLKQAELALRESEALARTHAEELETLMEVVPVGIWLAHDPDCHQVTVNRAAYKLMRAEPGEPTTATPTDGIYPLKFKLQRDGEDILAEELSLQKAGRTGQEVIQEAELVFEDGVVHYMYGRAVPLRDEVGNVRGVIGAYVDISDRKQAEVEREQLLAREQAAREAAEAANRVKDEFLAVLSHELRSPLNPILGWSGLLLNGKLDESKTKQALATIERNAKLQSELIEDLLDVSRILQGKLSLAVSSVNLAPTIQAAIETVRLAAEAKSIAIKTRLNPEIGLVSGDSTRLQQVVWNLLSNAVKFTPTGGQVMVQLEQVNTHAQITVCDTGKGISADFLPYVFDYFRQADSTTTRKFGGLGLGLAIVRHLVELHGGTVSVDSPGEGQGTTFTVRLPLMVTPSKLNQHEPLHEHPPDLSGIRILVVDDEIDARDLLVFLLEQQGAQMIAATSAHEALLLLTQSLPDILISDIGMPGMDGYMLIQQVRELAPEQGGQIPAIALTAYAGEINQQQALAAGFQEHISKPIEAEKLIHVISSLIRA